MTLLLDRRGPDGCSLARVWHADEETLAQICAVGRAWRPSLLCVDAPYSEKTHQGHAEGAVTANRAASYAGGDTKDARYAARLAVSGEAHRRDLNYGFWTPKDVECFVARWAPLTRGWFVSITDDVLAPVWRRALDQSGRYAFAPLPFVARGSGVRLCGDGPSSWTRWIVVARPREVKFSTWGTLPGAYLLPRGYSERMPVVGGKPLWLLERLVEDYSRPGDLIVDPCCGAGTALRAALRLGRRALGGDVLEEHARLAATALAAPMQTSLLVAGDGGGR